MTEHPSVARANEIIGVARDSRLRDLIRYWLSIHPGDRLPARQAFDPIEVPWALANLAMTEVERDPYRFRVRLMGTTMVAAFGADFTGRYMHEALPGFERSFSYHQRVEVVETGLPQYRNTLPSIPFKLDYAPHELVYLPFANDGVQVDLILTMAIYQGAELPRADASATA